MSKVFLFIVFLGVQFIFGQDPTYKSGFGSEGKLVIDIDDLDELVGLIKDDNGNTFFYGNTSQNLGGIYPFDFYIGKLDTYGNLDTEFGESGIFRGDFPGQSISSLNKAVYDTSGIYFIGGGRNAGATDTNHVFVGKITHNGQMDLNFANNGFFTHDFLGTYSTPGSLLIDKNHRVVFCGSTTDDAGTNVEYSMICRLNPNGVQDSTFGETGIVIWDYYSGGIVHGMQVDTTPRKHGEGAYLSQILELEDSYFVCGRFINTAFSQIQLMNINFDGKLNEDFASSGPYIFQVDPGSNHTINDALIFKDKIYLAIYTNGFREGSFLIQELDLDGTISNLVSIQNPDHEIRLNALDTCNNQLYLAGYSLQKSNVSPGYFSEDFLLYSLDSTLQFCDGLSTDSVIVDNMGTEDELGCEDFIFHSDFILTAGYMNRIEGNNYTDLAFMAYAISDDLENTEPEITFTLYPNPTSDIIYYQSENLIEKVEIIDLSGRVLLQHTPKSNHVDLNVSQLSAGKYVFKTTELETDNIHLFIKI